MPDLDADDEKGLSWNAGHTRVRAAKTTNKVRYYSDWLPTAEEARADLASKMAATPVSETQTFREAFEDYLEMRSHEESTKRTYINTFNQRFGKLAKKRISSLRISDFTSIYKEMETEGKAGQTIKQLHNTAVWSFKAARSNNWANVPGWIEDIVLPKGAKPKKRSGFDQPDAESLLTTFENSDAELRWVLAITLGCRPSEVRGLCWENVHLDAEHPYIYMTSKVVPVKGEGQVFFNTLKSENAHRNLYLTPEMVRLFKAQRRKQARLRRAGMPMFTDSKGNTPDLVFTQENGRPLTDTVERRAWKKIIDSSGVDYKAPYSMRHTAATHMLTPEENGGLGLAEAQTAAMLGHSDSSGRFTHNQYVDLVEGIKKTAAAKMAERESSRRARRLNDSKTIGQLHATEFEDANGTLLRTEYKDDEGNVVRVVLTDTEENTEAVTTR